MERKFRIIEKLSYTYDELDEQITIYIQEWKRGFWGRWKWRYWTTWSYDVELRRVFKTIHQAEQIIEKLINQKPHEKVVRELTYQKQ